MLGMRNNKVSCLLLSWISPGLFFRLISIFYGFLPLASSFSISSISRLGLYPRLIGNGKFLTLNFGNLILNLNSLTKVFSCSFSVTPDFEFMTALDLTFNFGCKLGGLRKATFYDFGQIFSKFSAEKAVDYGIRTSTNFSRFPRFFNSCSVGNQ